MADAPCPRLPALDNSMGAILISTLSGAALWGMSIVQTYEYYLDYPNDTKCMKWTVFSVCTLDTLHQVFVSHTIYTHLVTHFNEPTFLTQITWSLTYQVLISALNSFIVQSFFVRRIWILSNAKREKRNAILCGVVMILVVGNLASSLAYLGKGAEYSHIPDLIDLEALSHTINVFACSADITITVALVYLLLQSKGNMRRTNHIINRLVIYAVNTGFITSVFTIACLVSLIAWPDTMLYIALYEILCRLYTNSLLATLNARARIRTTLESTRATEPVSGGIVFHTPGLTTDGVASQGFTDDTELSGMDENGAESAVPSMHLRT